MSKSVAANLQPQQAGVLQATFSWKPEWDFNGYHLFKPSVGERKNELWKSTCFEVFTQIPDHTNYYEVNVSPMGHWNVYHFESYRDPISPKEEPHWRILKLDYRPGVFSFWIATHFAPGTPLRIGLNAIFNESPSPTSYWALRHASDRPDFHNPSTFILETITK